MRSDTARPGRVRLATTLTVVSAVMVVAGGILVVAGKRSGGHVTSLGAPLAAAGLAVGLVALLVFLPTRGGRSARRRPASHRRRVAASAAPGRQHKGVLDPTTVYSPGGLIDVPRDARASGSAGTTRTPGFYDPSGGIGPPGPQGPREPLRPPTAGSTPHSGPGEVRPPAGRMGPPPRPGYPASAQPVAGVGSGRRSPGPVGWPPHQPVPPSVRMGPGEAFPPRESPAARQASPPRQAPPPREAPPRSAPPPREAPPRSAPPPREAPPRSAPPPREAPPRSAPPPREAPPRSAPPPRPGYRAAPSGDPWRSDAPASPFEAGHPSRGAHPGPFAPAAGRGTGWPSAGPGYGPSAGRRPAPSGAPGPGAPGPGAPGPGTQGPGVPASAGPGGIFGGYAQVIRPSEHPGASVNRVRPGAGQPAGPAGLAPPADHDVYVYRDVSDPAPASPARRAAADDVAYWYDLLAEDHVPQQEETRGPFEPLLPSGETSSAAEPAGTEQPQGPPDVVRAESSEAPERARARKLEQLKDLYLTAEAIGEQNVDKHFDQLLAQQRELISDYFRQSAGAKPGASPDDGRQDRETNDPSAARHRARPPEEADVRPEGAGVRAEPPRAW